MTPQERLTQALNSLADLEHAAQDEDGRGGFTDDEIRQHAENVRSILGAIQYPVKGDDLQPLKAYKSGQYVEVLNTTTGAWVNGYISEIERPSGHLHVETEGGPITIGTNRRVRPQA